MNHDHMEGVLSRLDETSHHARTALNQLTAAFATLDQDGSSPQIRNDVRAALSLLDKAYGLIVGSRERIDKTIMFDLRVKHGQQTEERNYDVV